MQFLLAFTIFTAGLVQVLAQTNYLPNYLLGRSTKRSFLSHHERMHYANIHGVEALLAHEREEKDANYPNVEDTYFEQKLDHFNATDTRTWWQRVQVNKQFFNLTSDGQSNLFLLIGGEGELETKWTGKAEYQYLQMAKEHSAYVVQVEHRFFGKSQPLNTTELGGQNFYNLRYLTTQQALEDLAVYMKATNAHFKNPRWVVFGGSYPGAMAAVFRERYPDMSVGAIASSAVVNVQTDYYGYAQGMVDTIKLQGMDCYNAVNESFSKLHQQTLTSGGRISLTKIFNIQPPLSDNSTPLDITNFLANIFGTFQGVIQYSYDNRDVNSAKQTVGGICGFMTTHNVDPVQKLKNVYDWNNAFEGIKANAPLNNDYWAGIKQLQVTIWNQNNNDAFEARGWMALCCGSSVSDIGFLQTTDQGDNIFGSIVPLNFYVDMCRDIFDSSINIDFINKGVAAEKQYYIDVAKYNGTNVVLPNGQLDPWKRSGVMINNTANHEYAIIIDGIGHCGDMYPTHAGEPAGLDAARKLIFSEVAYYLSGKSVQTTTKIAGPLTSLSFLTIASSLLVFLLL
uniref:Serine protease K12H4.7 n=1 Tax=Rhabditophanes sp. KR3021 TaxID=114890 RepID=A0AC35TR50_9BILA